MTITLVTGNQHKLAEWRRLISSDIELESVDIDLVEIQTDDPKELVADKVKRAYEAVKKPVVVEDVSAGLIALGRLPGPLIKFFVKQMGRHTLHELSKINDDKSAYAAATIGYYDGKKLIVVTGEVLGTITEPRGESGFGLDAAFLPNGETKTYAEMTPEEKDKISHRSKAISLFVGELRKHLSGQPAFEREHKAKSQQNKQ